MSFSRTGKSLKRLMVLESSGNLFNSSKKNMMCMADNKDNMATLWVSSLLISIGCPDLNKNRNKPNDPVATVPKKDVIILLPYLGLHSNHVTKRLKSCVNHFYCFANVKVIFQNARGINSFFPYKDRFNRSQLSSHL